VQDAGENSTCALGGFQKNSAPHQHPGCPGLSLVLQGKHSTQGSKPLCRFQGHVIPARLRLPTVMRRVAIALLADMLLFTPGFAQVPAADPGSTYAPQFTEKGVEACLYCHDVERMRLILDTPHGDGNNPDAPFAQHDCESCHGPGSLHATRSRRGKGRPPMITYGENAKTPHARQSQTCLENCHNKTMGTREGMLWQGSAHGSAWKDAEGHKRAMSCSNCHEMHIRTESLKEKQAQATICYKCHQKTETEHPRFEEKGIDYDKLSCWDCHDVHQLIPSEDQNGNR
jgi:DmsE family decaheme c-type cytochrome